jgi:hypothetical protein
LDQNPSWGRHYDFAPLLKGKEYGKDFEGMFDLIGYVTTRTERKGDADDRDIVFPPGISFESPDGSFMAKWTGVGDKKKMKMNWAKILDAELNPSSEVSTVIKSKKGGKQ